jgi:hypothetical protein
MPKCEWWSECTDVSPLRTTISVTDKKLKRFMQAQPEAELNPVPPTPQLVLGESDDMYLLNNFACSHKKVPPSPSAVRDDSCAVLQCLGLYWSPLLQALIQPSCIQILLHQDLVPLLKSSAERFEGHTPEALLSHITRSFDVREQDCPEMIYNRIHKGLQVEGAIPGLNEPEPRFLCNICGKWVDKMARHRWAESKKEGGHTKAIDKKPQKHYTISLFNQQDLRSFRVPLSEGWKPPPTKVPAIPLPIITPTQATQKNASAPTYIQAIGYISYLDCLDLQHPTELVALVEPLSRQVAHRFLVGTLA